MALITVSGHLLDPSGAATAGTVTFLLTNYTGSVPRVIGTNAIVDVKVTFTANASGAWSGSIQGNDTIDPGAANTPPTTYYSVTFKTASNVIVMELPFQFTGAGPANLDSQAPLSPLPSPATIPNNAGLLAANQTWTGTNTFNGATVLGNTESVSNSGIFTDTQLNQYLTSIVNGLNFTTEFQLAEGGHGTTEAVSGGVAIGSGATVLQAEGIGGYVNNASTTTFGFGGYFQGRATANSVKVGGINPVAIDTTGLTTAITLYGSDLVVAPRNASTAYSIVQGYSAALNAAVSGQYGQAFDANIGAGGVGQWNFAFRSRDGAAATAVIVGATAASGTVNSQPVEFVAYNASVQQTGTVTLNSTPQFILNADGSHALTVPNVADTLVARTTTDTLTNKTLTSPVINGNPTGTGIPTVTLKKGSGSGNYTSASTSYVRVDSTNLAYTVTIPTGWKLGIQASGIIGTATAVVTASAALADGSADNTGILVETQTNAQGAGNFVPFSLSWVITGDGASHTVNLQFKTANAADSATIGNGNSTVIPTIMFILTPSN